MYAFKRDLLRNLFLALAMSCRMAMRLSADEKPPDDAFHSAFEFKLRVPDSFKASGSHRGYLETATGKAPYLDHVWKRDTDVIHVRAFVAPKVSWEASPQEMFSGAKRNMLTDPKLTLVSERDYEVGGCPAHSFVFECDDDNAKFQRMDYILTKPDLNIVGFFSSQKTSLEDKACRGLFESISIRARKDHGLQTTDHGPRTTDH